MINIESKSARNLCRIVGGIDASLGILIGDFTIKNYHIGEIMKLLPLADTLEKQALVGTYEILNMASTTLGTLLSAFLIVDGVSDVIKGEHHYFGQKIIERIPRLNSWVNGYKGR